MFLQKGFVFFIVFSLFSINIQATEDAHSQINAILTPAQVLVDLKKGNQRFVTNQLLHRNYQEEMHKNAGAQYPEAVVLSCMDSRNIPELSFDQGIGDIFALRIAGNILNDDTLGSMEYATAISHAALIVVMGHTSCGAMEAVCKNIKLGHLSALVKKIQPALIDAKRDMPNAACSDPAFINDIARHNVLHVMKQIPAKSPIIANLISTGKVAIVGAIFDIRTGKVIFIHS